MLSKGFSFTSHCSEPWFPRLVQWDLGRAGGARGVWQHSSDLAHHKILNPKWEHSATLELLTLLSKLNLTRNRILNKNLWHSLWFLNLAPSASGISEPWRSVGSTKCPSCLSSCVKLRVWWLGEGPQPSLDFSSAGPGLWWSLWVPPNSAYSTIPSALTWFEELDLITPGVDLMLGLASQSNLSVIHRF